MVEVRKAPRVLFNVLFAAFLAFICIMSASAQTVVSMEEIGQQGQCSLEDLAVQRFQVYGLLDEKAEGNQLVTVGTAATLINTFFDGVELDPEDANRKATEEDLAGLLLATMGYDGYEETAVGLAESIGLRPIGLAGDFGLGDVMLYLEHCLEMKDAGGTSMRDRAHIPDDLEQHKFPQTVIVYPTNLEDAEKQIRRAFQYIPYYISIRMGNGLTASDLDVLETRYKSLAASIINDTDDVEVWWLPYVHWYENDFRLGVSRISDSNVRLRFDFSDVGYLLADLDDAFTPFKDDTITKLADAFYRENIAPYKGQYEETIIRKIEEAISKNASYDFDAARGMERDAAFHVSGFFEDGKMVCLGYSQLFSYLCLRSDIEAITVLGDSRSDEYATRAESNHIWNKVKVDGIWYNEDICWGDNDKGCWARESLRSDASFSDRHHAAEHLNGVYAAKFDYEPTVKTRGFDDVPADAYYFNAVRWAAARNIAAGTGAYTFSPGNACTRGQVVTFLWRAAGSPKPVGGSPFCDVSTNSYYRDAVCWAAEQGIATGTSTTTFSPDDICTRAQVVTFLWRWNGTLEAENNIIPFNDVAANDYFTGAAMWAAEQGIAAGTGPATFSPNSVCTRAQVVTFLWRADAA